MAESTDPEVKRLNIVFSEFKQAGGSQRSFAALTGISQATISRMLKGEKHYPISLNVVRMVCYKLGYSPEWFIKGEGPKKVKPEKAGKIVTDIEKFRVENDITNAKVDRIAARLKYLEDQLEKKV